MKVFGPGRPPGYPAQKLSLWPVFSVTELFLWLESRLSYVFVALGHKQLLFHSFEILAASMPLVGRTPKTAGTFQRKFRKSLGKTLEMLSRLLRKVL